jgi:hypothetical protein
MKSMEGAVTDCTRLTDKSFIVFVTISLPLLTVIDDTLKDDVCYPNDKLM